jgi:L-arabinose isomerase
MTATRNPTPHTPHPTPDTRNPTPDAPHPHVVLLPCYIKLYDDLLPALRDGFAGFLEQIAAALEERGVAVTTAPICRVAEEFDAAVSRLEEAKVDALMTVHLAYSPSLEAIDAVCRTRLPLILLDTTMDADFGIGVSPDRIMFDHGVHGVMDFASMLRRRKRPFEIVAGHVDDAAMLDTAAGLVRAAMAAAGLRGGRLMRIGRAFAGMGDFVVTEEALAARFGLEVRHAGMDVLDSAIAAVSEEAVDQEIAEDRERFACEISQETHARSVRVGLGLRRLLDEGGFSGFSINFQLFDRADRPANTMPFLEISKAMARGIGYAGEGDVLTAALVGALARAFGEVTFTEVFCPDWSGDSLFLSHMGEISPSVAGDVPRLFSKPLFSGGSLDPALLTCAVRPGPAVFVNLAPGPDDTFSLIVAEVEVLAENGSLDPAMRDVVRAWVRPRGGVKRFLEAYSRAGGTHHSALVLGDRADAVSAFGRMSGLEVVRL